MLVSLNVKNFAIIDNIEIDFKDKMTVLTGETGAGKSLIIDAIGLLFGERASSDMIRYGETKASISGVFTSYDEEIEDLMNELGVDFDKDESLIIKREIYSNGKSICKINSDIVSLNDLQRVGNLIGDIHCQEDSFGLINPKNYLAFLKNKEINEKLSLYENLLKEYSNIKKEYNDKILENDELTKQVDFLKYQCNEFKLANLSLNEEEELKNEFNYLSNYSKVIESINAFKDIYDNKNALDLIYESLSYLEKLSKFDEKYKDLYKSLLDSYYNIESIVDNNLFKKKDADFDQNRLDEINSRLGLYSDLKRKYKLSTEGLINYYYEIKEKLNNIDSFDETIEELKLKMDNLYKETASIALEIRHLRQNLAKELEEKIKDNLKDLELKNTLFEVEFNKIDENDLVFNKDGVDSIDFMVSFNKGELLKPLSKVASGGELSRFMLALKVVLGDKLPQQTKIFDEIDSGVSGSCAYAIALKIKEISKRSQVLCITHLPQVASIADNHLKISKYINEGRTYTIVNVLDKDERIEEVASMISNGDLTPASVNLARELLINNGNL